MNSKTLLAAGGSTAALALGALAAWTPVVQAAPAPVDAAPAAVTPVARAAAVADPSLYFKMVRSTGVVAAGCLPSAQAVVKVTPGEHAETMRVRATGLQPNAEYDLFVLQVPDAPFGLSWYQGDLESDADGSASSTFVGRFNEETFSVAPGVAPAPVRHSSPFADASSNPATAPVHQYHVGLWFNSPDDAAKAGCPAAVTPFNGEHDAGVQVLSTRQFPVGAGPLSRLGS